MDWWAMEIPARLSSSSALPAMRLTTTVTFGIRKLQGPLGARWPRRRQPGRGQLTGPYSPPGGQRHPSHGDGPHDGTQPSLAELRYR
jgi:hypothetical protein